MTALRDRAIQSARVAHESVMDSLATIYRRTQTPDTTGGHVDSFTAVGTYPCAFARYPVRPLERENAQRVQTISTWAFRFPVGTEIRSTDRIMVGTRTFEVVSAGSGTVEITSQAICQEIT